MDFVIAIPSYNRYKTIEKKTLKMLNECNIKKDNISIFVANIEQKSLYEEEIGNDYNIVIGKLGMCNIRNFITDYYEEGKYIIFIDDDIISIKKGQPNGKMVTKIYNLTEIINDGFNLCKENDTKLWGLHPSNNCRSLKSKNIITINLKYIIGAFYGVINDKSIKVTIDCAEDFQRTILYYKKYGKVIRINNMSAFTTYYSNGGLNDSGRTNDTDLEHKKKLCDLYPAYCKLYKTNYETTNIKLNYEKKIPVGGKNY